MPDVYKESFILKHCEAPENLQGVEPRRWVKPLPGGDWLQTENGIDDH